MNFNQLPYETYTYDPLSRSSVTIKIYGGKDLHFKKGQLIIFTNVDRLVKEQILREKLQFSISTTTQYD